jgi:hypothetical protein
MKISAKQLGLLMLVSLALATSVSVGFAGQGGFPPHYVWLIKENIEPGQMDAYMKCRVEGAKMDAKHRFPFPYVTSVENFTIHTAGIFRKFAEIDGFTERMIDYNKKTGGKYKELHEQAQKCVSHTSTFIDAFRPDLSYSPEEPAFTPDFSKRSYSEVVVYTIKPDKLEQAVELAKKVKTLHEQKGASLAYRVYERICGDGLPALTVIMNAENEVQLDNVREKTVEKLGEDFANLMKELFGVLERTETVEATYIPEASYVPAKSRVAEGEKTD